MHRGLFCLCWCRCSTSDMERNWELKWWGAQIFHYGRRYIYLMDVRRKARDRVSVFRLDEDKRKASVGKSLLKTMMLRHGSALLVSNLFTSVITPELSSEKNVWHLNKCGNRSIFKDPFCLEMCFRYSFFPLDRSDFHHADRLICTAASSLPPLSPFGASDGDEHITKLCTQIKVAVMNVQTRKHG